jgi:hypothetical protein
MDVTAKRNNNNKNKKGHHRYDPHEDEWTPFRAHYFSENVVALGFVARNSDH